MKLHIISRYEISYHDNIDISPLLHVTNGYNNEGTVCLVSGLIGGKGMIFKRGRTNGCH